MIVVCRSLPIYLKRSVEKKLRAFASFAILPHLYIYNIKTLQNNQPISALRVFRKWGNYFSGVILSTASFEKKTNLGRKQQQSCNNPVEGFGRLLPTTDRAPRVLSLSFTQQRLRIEYINTQYNVQSYIQTHRETQAQMIQSAICKGYRTGIWWVSVGCNDLSAATEIFNYCVHQITVCVCAFRCITAVKNKWERCVPWVNVESQSSHPLHLTASTLMVRKHLHPRIHPLKLLFHVLLN